MAGSGRAQVRWNVAAMDQPFETAQVRCESLGINLAWHWSKALLDFSARPRHAESSAYMLLKSDASGS
jgi:hypothetical protein